MGVKATRSLMCLRNGINLLWRSVAMALPPDAQVTLETLLLAFGQTPPESFALRPNRVDDCTPIEAAQGRVADVTAKAAQQRARLVRVQRGNDVEWNDVRVNLGKAAVAREHVHSSAMAATSQRDENVESRKTGADYQNVTADSSVIETPRIGDVPGVESYFERQKLVVRQRIARSEDDRSRGKTAARPLDNEAIAGATLHGFDSIRHVRESRALQRMLRYFAHVVAVELPGNEIGAISPNAQPTHEVIGIARIEAHLVRARVQQVLAVRSAVRGAAAGCIGLEDREREAGLGRTRKMRCNGASAKATADDCDVEVDHPRTVSAYAGSISS